VGVLDQVGALVVRRHLRELLDVGAGAEGEDVRRREHERSCLAFYRLPQVDQVANGLR
jgi:hypothetical protein